MSRYQEITTFAKKLYTPDAPILVEKAAVYYDTKEKRRAVLCKVRNLSTRTIVSADVMFKLYDQAGKPLSDGMPYTYTDLQVLPDATFGAKTPIMTQVKGVARCCAYVTRVVFEGGLAWVAAADAKWGALAAPKPIESILPSRYQQLAYRYTYGDTANYVYQRRSGLHVCTCGTICGAGCNFCSDCGASFSELATLDTAALETEGIYLDAITRLGDECSTKELQGIRKTLVWLGGYKDSAAYIEHTDALLAAKAARAKKIKRRAIFSSAAATAMATVAVLAFTLFIPLARIGIANSYYEEGRYSEALAIYRDVGRFESSRRQIAVIEANDALSTGVANYPMVINSLLTAGVPVQVHYNTNTVGNVAKAAKALSLSTAARTTADAATPEAITYEAVETYDAQGKFISLYAAKKTGYSLSYWSFSNCSYDIGEKDPIFHLVLNAVWAPRSYSVTLEGVTPATVTVTLDPNYSGAETSAIALENGETLNYPTIPSRNGYVFTGWYTDAECTMRYGFDAAIDADMTLYAAWTPMLTGSASVHAQISPADHPTNMDAFSASTYDTASYYPAYYYIVAERTGTNYIYYKNSSSGWSRSYYLTVQNMTTGALVLYDKSVSNTTYSSVGVTCEAGDVIALSIYTSNYYYSTASFYFTGFQPEENKAVASVNGAWYDPEVSFTQAVTFGQSYTLPVATRPGYAFLGWYDGETKVESGVWQNDKDLTLKAKWQAGGNTLTLDPSGGTVAEGYVAVIYESEYTLPTPQKTGYTFLGWFADGVQYTDGIWLESEDVTLVAEWTPNKYSLTLDDMVGGMVTVTFDKNYSGAEASTETLKNGDTLARPAVPSRNGYVFTGWYTDAACTTRYDFTGEITADMTLYAGWRLLPSMTTAYSVEVINPAEYTSSMEYLSTSTGYTNYSYTKNYVLVAEESGTHYIYYKNYDSYWYYSYYLTITNLTTGDTILWDVCVSNTSYYNISFSCSAGDVIQISLYATDYYDSSTAYFYFSGFGEAPASTAIVTATNYAYDADSDTTLSVTYGEEYTLPIITRPGYTFLGWYRGNVKVEDGVWNRESDLTLVPRWQANISTITLDPNGGTVSTGSLTATYGSAYTLPTPQKTGNTFLGWFADDVQYTSGIWQGMGDVTLVAAWEPANYTLTLDDAKKTEVTVTFDRNYSSAETSTEVLQSGDTLARPAVPSRNGYVFTGWYTDAACTTRYDFTGEITADMTLYAGWIASPTTSDSHSVEVINPAGYTSSENPYSTSTYGSRYGYTNKYLLVAEESGTHYIYYKNYESYSSYAYYLTITNLTTGATILGDTYVSNTSYYNVNLNCSAGDVIQISLYASYSYNDSTAYFYFSGFGEAPASTATAAFAECVYDANSTAAVTVAYGEAYTLPTPARAGYTFLGWFADDVQYTSGIWQGTGDVTLVAAWVANTYTLTFGNSMPTGVSVTLNYNYTGATDEVIELGAGETLAYPSAPQRSG